eukprot:2837253-Alexandrium_andersonii.AAC.1
MSLARGLARAPARLASAGDEAGAWKTVHRMAAEARLQAAKPANAGGAKAISAHLRGASATLTKLQR